MAKAARRLWIGAHGPWRPVLKVVRPRRLPSGMTHFDPVQTLSAKIAVQRGNHPMWVRKPSAHNLHIPPKFPSVVVLSDDIALREGGV